MAINMELTDLQRPSLLRPWLTEEEFNAILPLLGSVSEKRIHVAKEFLVNRRTARSIADELGVTKNSVYKTDSLFKTSMAENNPDAVDKLNDRTSYKRSSEAEFNAIMPMLSSLSTRRIHMAKEYLIDGKDMQVIADEFGVTKNSVHKSVARIWDEIVNYRLLSDDVLVPSGWVKVTLVAPRRLIPVFRKQIEDEYQDLI
jgi:predicted DNA-binding protein YlxM (UPF0122 family)